MLVRVYTQGGEKSISISPVFRRVPALDQLHRELDRINLSAARSLEEGMEETLTVHKLRGRRACAAR
jgi:hypothetical protein